MIYLTGAVYSPPSAELPFLVVIFDPDGKIRVTRAVDTAEAGESVLTRITQSLDELSIAEFFTPGRQETTARARKRRRGEPETLESPEAET